MNPLRKIFSEKSSLKSANPGSSWWSDPLGKRISPEGPRDPIWGIHLDFRRPLSDLFADKESLWRQSLSSLLSQAKQSHFLFHCWLSHIANPLGLAFLFTPYYIFAKSWSTISRCTSEGKWKEDKIKNCKISCFISILKKVSPSLVHFFMHRLQLNPRNRPVSHLGEVAGKVSTLTPGEIFSRRS